MLCGRLPEHLQALGRLERWQSGGAERGTGQRRASEGDERLRMRACGSEGVASRVGGRATMRALGLCALNHGSNADTAEQQRMELVVARLQGAREPAVCHRRTRADGRQTRARRGEDGGARASGAANYAHAWCNRSGLRHPLLARCPFLAQGGSPSPANITGVGPAPCLRKRSSRSATCLPTCWTVRRQPWTPRIHRTTTQHSRRKKLRSTASRLKIHVCTCVQCAAVCRVPLLCRAQPP